MAEELARSLFEKARDRYENSRRIAFALVIGLLVFHLTTFLPYVRTAAQLYDAERESDRVSELSSEVESIRGELAKLESRVESKIDAVMANMLENKVEDFRRLNRMVSRIRNEATGEQPQFHVQQPVQGTPDSTPSPSGLPPLGDDLENKIAQEQDIEALRRLLEPYIREHIIGVHFEALNRDLRQTSASIQQDGEALRGRAEEMALENPSYAEELTEIAGSLGSFVEALEGLEIRPPEDDMWWASVERKTTTLDELGADVDRALSRYLNRELSERISSDLNAAIRRQEALKSSLEEEIKELEEQFKAQQEQMQSMGSFLKWGVLSLGPVAATFPLLLALILASASFMASRRTHELALAISILPDEQDDLWRWFLNRVGGIRDPSPSPRWTPPEVLVASAVILWVGVAAWQAAGWGEVGPLKALAMFALAVPLLASAGWYRRRTIQAVVGLAEENRGPGK